MPLRPGVYEPRDAVLERGGLAGNAEERIAAWRGRASGREWQRAQSGPQRNPRRTPFEHCVYGIDRFLRRRQGIYEYTTHAQCLFRIERSRAEHGFKLADGAQVRAGDRLLKLHLWNEHIPAMGSQGPSVACLLYTSPSPRDS